MIYFTSDWHFNHDREFVYSPRNVDCIDDMNHVILNNHNNIVTNNDDVYVLGDLMLGGTSLDGLNYIKAMNGKLHIIRGNHDTDKRIKLYKELPNVVEVVDAKYLTYNEFRFFLCHYPTFTSSLENPVIEKALINLYGHMHQKTNFYEDIPFMYHVGVDSHNCKPVSIYDVIIDIKAKVKECYEKI